MPKLPVVSGKDLIKAFSKIGYSLDHQTGSHMVLRHRDPPYRRLTIPNHKEIAKSTVSKIMNQSGLTREEFLKLL